MTSIKSLIPKLNFHKTIQEDHINKKIKLGLSVFTALKNRANSFEQALQSWLQHSEIHEIIVVDWSSDKSLLPIIQSYQDDRILLAYVKNEKNWNLAQAFNLAARLTSRNTILKIDADVKLLPSFFRNNTIVPRTFVTGNWRIAQNENEKSLNGNILVYRKDFFRVNGYNEYLKNYGWDDSDLYQRLKKINLKQDFFSHNTLYHIPHDNRTTYRKPLFMIPKVPDSELAKLSNRANEYYAKVLDPWSDKLNLQRFTLKKNNDNYYSCRKLKRTRNKIPRHILRKGKMYALQFRLVQLGEVAFEELDFLTYKELYKKYQEFLINNSDNI